jgi:rhodanese-related sulfurtransferase
MLPALSIDNNTEATVRHLVLSALLTLVAHPALAADPFDDIFDLDDLRVWITPDLPYLEVQHEGEAVTIMRHQNPDNRIVPEFAKTSRSCPPFCVQPMHVHPDVETIGELELLGYLERQAKGDDQVLIIDSRSPESRARGTIPGSMGIPWVHLDPAHAEEREVAEILQFELGATRREELWDFSNAKTLVLFCNGLWCGQSPTNIRALLTLGYPPEKLKWYRGGLQAWEQLGLTTVGG